MRYFIIIALLALPPSFAMAGSNGINSLTTVSTLKSSNANDDALHGADAGRSTVQSQKNLRSGLGAMDDPHSVAPATGLGAPKTARDHAAANSAQARKPAHSNAATLRAIDAELSALQQKMDSLSDLSEDESRKIQMYQERMSKMMSTLSNIMKKSSDTQSGIIGNLK